MHLRSGTFLSLREKLAAEDYSTKMLSGRDSESEKKIDTRLFLQAVSMSSNGYLCPSDSRTLQSALKESLASSTIELTLHR